MQGIIFLGIVLLAALIYMSAFSIKEYERGIILRFGVFNGIREPGLNFIIPLIDELIRVPLSKKILFERIKSSTINVNLENEEIVFDVQQKLKAEVGEDGIITVITDPQ